MKTAGSWILPFVASSQRKKGMDNRNILIIARCPCHVVNGLPKDLFTLNVNARRSDQRKNSYTSIQMKPLPVFYQHNPP